MTDGRLTWQDMNMELKFLRMIWGYSLKCVSSLRNMTRKGTENIIIKNIGIRHIRVRGVEEREGKAQNYQRLNC